MTGPAYRNTARWHFEPAPRPPMAHRLPMAHREPAPEPLWRAVLVYLVGIPLIAVIVLVALGGPG